MKLTPDFVRRAEIPVGKTEAIIFDSSVPGFGLRLREGGSKSFVFQYKIGAKQRRMALGKATPDNLADARKAASKFYSRVKHSGEDPASDRAVARTEAAQTFKAVAVEYLESRKSELRPTSYTSTERSLLVYASPLHELQIGKIHRADIAALLAAVTKRIGAATANRMRAALSSFFGWSMQNGRIENNPVIGTPKNTETPRERILAPAELRAIWGALPVGDYGNIIRLLALTGQRLTEIGALRWSEIHGDAIVLPPERTKNGRHHLIPLSEPAREIIEKQVRRPGRDLIFGRGKKSFSGWDNCKQRLDAKITETIGRQLEHWTPHDLRRTFATYCGGMPEHELQKLSGIDKELARGLGIQPHVTECVLNHVGGFRAGVVATYNKSDYASEKRQALNLWAERLLAIVQDRPSVVVPLRA